MRPLLRLRAHPRQKENQARAYPPTSPAPQGAVSAAPLPLCPPPRPEPGLATVLAVQPGLGRSGTAYASPGGESRSPAGVRPAAGRHFLALRGDPPPGPGPSAWGRVSPASPHGQHGERGEEAARPTPAAPGETHSATATPGPYPGGGAGALTSAAGLNMAPPSRLLLRAGRRHLRSATDRADGPGCGGGGLSLFTLAPGSLRASAPATRLRARLLPLVGGSCRRAEEPRPVVR